MSYSPPQQKATFQTEVQVLLGQVDANYEEVYKAVEVLNHHQYFHLMFLLLLESLYPKHPDVKTYLSDTSVPSDAVKGIHAALNKSSNFMSSLEEMKNKTQQVR